MFSSRSSVCPAMVFPGFLRWCLLATLVAGVSISLGAQSNTPAAVRDVIIAPAAGGITIQILASRPITPIVQKLENPPRVVIDLPDALFSAVQKRITVNRQHIIEIRASQFQNTPPVTRVVVQLKKLREYSVSSQGNNLSVKLTPVAPQAGPRPMAAKPEQPTTVLEAGAVPPPAPVAMVEAATPTMTLQGASSITAGADTTVLRLPRGGEVRICPGTAVSVTPSGHDLMVGLNTGAIETHYALSSAADVILTPDFRILLPGPGRFDFAISADQRGNTCVRSLTGNTASLMVSELMGDGNYQVHPSDQVVFTAGRLRNVSSVMPQGCGCPPIMVPVTRAQAPAVNTSPVASPTATPSVTSPPPPVKTGEAHVQVDAPFVFRATDPVLPAAPVVAHLRLVGGRPPTQLLNADAEPPPPVTNYNQQAQPAKTKSSRGFLAKLRGFFGAMFR